MKKLIFLALFLSSKAFSNNIGTEYQNFNPDISGTDFTTVHSSEPVKQCMCNLGVFINYAKNTLTYSDIFYQTNTDLVGTRANDYLIGADVYGTFGISDNWDVGVALPFILTARNDDPYGVSYFDEFGLTEIRPMTKYRFKGDDQGGMAVVVSMNFNTIKENPFAGNSPGPTLNVELAVDTTTDSGMKLAGNVGYRKRNSGDQITDTSTGLPPPFVPFSDSFIFSGALAKHIESLNSDLVGEIKGSLSGKTDDENVRKSQQGLEAGFGLRHDWSKATVVHAGLGTKLADAQATPDIRVYAGLSYQVGSVCGSKVEVPKEEIVKGPPTAVVNNHPNGESAVTNLNMPVTALDPTDYAAYKWKIGSTPQMNCQDEAGYSAEVAGDQPIVTNIESVPEGGITLCAVAKNLGGAWQPYSDPTIVSWIKTHGPIAVVLDHPVGVSKETDPKMRVTAENPQDYSAYRWKIGPAPEMNCNDESGYSAETPKDTPLTPAIGPFPDGGITLCAVAKNLGGVWQPFKDPTIVQWEKKRGYELFRLNASVLFDFDKSELQERSVAELEKVRKHLSKKPWAKCIVEGHTDSMGTDEYNMDLSKRRAVTVYDYMIKTFGFPAEKMGISAKGESQPVDTNATDEGRANNRRVEFKIYRK